MANNFHGTLPGASALEKSNLSWSMFPQRTEVTEESSFSDFNEELQLRQRQTLRDFSPDRPELASDLPRRDNWSEAKINLGYQGSFGGEAMPWKNDDYDLQFHDADPRGWQNEPNWQLGRRDDEARWRRQPFRNDADYSIPSDGVHPVTMFRKIKEMVAKLHGTLFWFQDSKGAIASGRGPKQFNTHAATALDDIEDTSATIDTSASNLESLRDVNSIISNNVHLGGKFFVDRTTTDQLVPQASYETAFKLFGLESPESKVRMANETRKINPLVVARENRRDLMRFLSARTKENRAFVEGGERFGEGDRSRYSKILEAQAAPQGRIIIKDIMALMGITEAEIKWLNSSENKNKSQQKQAIACIAELIVGLEKLPPNARLALRDELLWQRVKGAPMPKTRSGLSNSQLTVEAKRVLKSSNSTFGFLKNARGREAFGDPEAKIRELISSGNFFVSKRRRNRDVGRVANQLQQLPGSSEHFQSSGSTRPIQKKSSVKYNSKTDQFIDEARESIKKTALVFAQIKSGGDAATDNNFGTEHFFDATLRSAPKAKSTNKLRFQ